MDMDSIFSAASAAAGAAQTANKRARTTVIQDPSSYQQHEQIFINGGLKKRSLTDVLRSNIIRLDYTFKGLRDFNGYGNYWMHQYPVSSADESPMKMPCYFFAMNGCNQEGLTMGNSTDITQYTRPMRMAVRGNSAWYSDTIDGQAPDATNSSVLWPTTDSVNNVDSVVGAMGPRGYLNWTLFKINLWGCRYKQTTFYIDICSVSDADGNPFRYAPGSLFPTTLSQHLDEMMRPLTVNPISTANNLTPSPWRVLKRVKVSIDPISTTEGDQDPHCKTLNLFNRWGRAVDFKSFIYEPGPNTTNVEFANVREGVKDVSTSVTHHLPEDDKMLFLVIRCNVYHRHVFGAGPTNDLSPSFDVSFRSSWNKL